MKTLLFITLLGVAAAQSSVVSMFIPDTDLQPLVASIMGQVCTDHQRNGMSIN